LDEQVTILNRALLEEVIGCGWPDHLWSQIEWKSPQAAVVWILDWDYTYTEWMASLSLDGRWTLSPRH
jgi:hypothetical protein